MRLGRRGRKRSRNYRFRRGKRTKRYHLSRGGIRL